MWEPASRAFPRPMWLTVVRLIYCQVSHHDCFKSAGYWIMYIRNAEWPLAPSKVLCQWNKGPPLSPVPSIIISPLYFSRRTARSPFAFVSGLLQYDVLRCIQVVSGFSFLLWLYSMGRLLFAYLSMGIWVVTIVFPPRDWHTILSGRHTPTVRFHHIVQVSSLSHSAHSFSGLSTCFQYFMTLWDNATNV